MLEFESDQESISRAENLSSLIMHDLRIEFDSEEIPSLEVCRKLFSKERYAEQAEGVPISDVIANVGQMAAEFVLAHRWNNKRILCQMLGEGELAPISILNLFPGAMTFRRQDWLDDIKFIELLDHHIPFPMKFIFREFFDNWDSRGLESGRIKTTDFREAFDGIESSLKSFLSYRFAGMKKWNEWIRGPLNEIFGGSARSSDTISVNINAPPPTVGPGGGLKVQVSCLTPGLRIHISPAYFINWVFFGSPSTPVTSYVHPGRYIFAGDGPMLPKFTQDNGVFSIPPTYYPSVARF